MHNGIFSYIRCNKKNPAISYCMKVDEADTGCQLLPDVSNMWHLKVVLEAENKIVVSKVRGDWKGDRGVRKG